MVTGVLGGTMTVLPFVFVKLTNVGVAKVMPDVFTGWLKLNVKLSFGGLPVWPVGVTRKPPMIVEVGDGFGPIVAPCP